MRTTLDIDDRLLADAQAHFPPGTPKTVIFEEALRRLIAGADTGRAASELRRSGDPRVERLVAEGRLVRAAGSDVPAPPASGMRLEDLLGDLSRDRADR